VTNAERYRFADFTRENYRRLLSVAKKRFRFCTFTEALPADGFALWRHDLDFSVHAGLKFAQIEYRENVRATYFIHLHSYFYNPFEPDVAKTILQIHELGHEIGLHVDGTYKNHADLGDLERSIPGEARCILDLLGLDVRVMSFHMPSGITANARAASYAGLVNADADRFRTALTYCSDSNGYWRFRPLEDVLRDSSVSSLQVLTHPEMWTDEPLPPRQRVLRCIDGRAANTLKWYDKALESGGRRNVDWL
jgi:hypothetical protein